MPKELGLREVNVPCLGLILILEKMYTPTNRLEKLLN